MVKIGEAKKKNAELLEQVRENNATAMEKIKDKHDKAIAKAERKKKKAIKKLNNTKVVKKAKEVDTDSTTFKVSVALSVLSIVTTVAGLIFFTKNK